MFNKKRFGVVFLLALAVAIPFWTQSRYPDLDAKAMMAESGESGGGFISVWPVLQISPSDGFLTRVFKSSVNWANDNWKGMSFGLFLGAVFLTLMSYVQLRPGGSRLTSTFLGFFLGSPLGVCVNCAAPIFKGILASKRVETAFAAMFSSPTMNVVVLTMVFTLFPFYMAMVKVGFCLLVIFGLVPLLSRILPAPSQEELDQIAAKGEQVLSPLTDAAACAIPLQESFGQAIWGSLKDLGRNILWIVKKTVPLMLVAGVLGAVMSHAIPFTWFHELRGVAVIFLASLIGVFLPVPVAFDVILTHALFTQGVGIPVTLTLLCTLGIYSIYSFLITWTSTSKSWALSLFVILTIIGGVVGLIGPSLHQTFYVEPNLRAYHQAVISDFKQDQRAVDLDQEVSVKWPAQSPPLTYGEPTVKGRLAVAYTPFNKRPASAPREFVKLEGHEIGLTLGFRYGIRDYPDPFWIGRGTASGDYDGDGWDDLLLGSSRGPVLYKNLGGFFKRQDISYEPIKKLIVYGVAFVDLDNDGWLDIFLTSFKAGNYLILNRQGKFDFADLRPVSNGGAVLTISPAFGDFNGDGLLDIVNGNMALGVITGSWKLAKDRDNSLTYNYGSSFVNQVLPGYSGETMSTLVSDLNDDGILDIYFGNDFVVPDNLFYGKSQREFLVDHQSKPNLRTPIFSMAADSGDFNNDLYMDLLTTGTIRKRSWVGTTPIDGVDPEVYTKHSWVLDTCHKIKDPYAKQNCIINRETNHLVDFSQEKNVDVEDCHRLKGKIPQQDCLMSTMWMVVTGERSIDDCQQTFAKDPLLRDVCKVVNRKGSLLKSDNYPESMPQKADSFLYVGGKGGTLTDINQEMAKYPHRYRHPGGWTWSSRFADLDHDGFLDIFNAEGTVRQNDYGFNVYMKNIMGGFFKPHQFTANLTDPFNLFSYTFVDFDHDGDLDIIGNSSVGPIQVYVNHSSGPRQSILVELRDSKGNRYGLGAKVYLQMDGDKRQVREIKASGGYLSFDAPRAHFGLGSLPHAAGIEIKWPDGVRDRWEGPILPGRYKISRN